LHHHSNPDDMNMSDMSNHPTKLDPHIALDENNAEDVVWYSPLEAPFLSAGCPWLRQDGKYRRMPVSPSHPLPPAVNAIANFTAGGQIRFRTNSQQLYLRVRLRAVAAMYQ